MGATTMRFGECEGVLLCVHTHEAPSAEEWQAYVAYCCSLPKTCTRTLVVTEGGGPNAAQRKMLQDRYLDHVRGAYRVAVMTDSALVRGIVKALNWFNPLTEAFPYNGGEGVATAIRHLAVSEGTARNVRLEIEAMRRSLKRQDARVSSATTPAAPVA